MLFAKNFLNWIIILHAEEILHTKLKYGKHRFTSGEPRISKSDEFSEKFQTAFDPAPHFRKVVLRISQQNCDKSAYVNMEVLLCIL